MVDLFKGLKKVTETIEKPLSQLERIAGKDKEKEGKPKIRSEHKFTAWNYYFICDICGTEYGPKNSMIPQMDGGVKILENLYMRCTECRRFICKPRCWNYNIGKCLSCVPSKEIEMKRMKPKIRSEHKIPMWQYYFACDICDKDYGPEKSMSRQSDEGINICQKHYRQCPDCGKFICSSQCWNYEKGTCTLCNALTPPEYIVKAGKLKNDYYLICSVCRKQFGPISEVDWGKVLKIASGATKITLGAILTLGGTAVSGGYDIAMGVKGGPTTIKSVGEVATDAKTDLAQCPSCNRWVCIDNCWDKTVGFCNACSRESEGQK
ncbi:MAG: hypothetical protein KAJ51_00855 [Thermoplasmata archaeon]|nr:hypothetical protein [Thermoplasmata archaeon]